LKDNYEFSFNIYYFDHILHIVRPIPDVYQNYLVSTARTLTCVGQTAVQRILIACPMETSLAWWYWSPLDVTQYASNKTNKTNKKFQGWHLNAIRKYNQHFENVQLARANETRNVCKANHFLTHGEKLLLLVCRNHLQILKLYHHAMSWVLILIQVEDPKMLYLIFPDTGFAGYRRYTN